MKDLQKIAVVIDADHIQACSISDVLCKISTYGRITVKRAYGDWRKESLNNWETELRRLAIKAEQQFDERSAGMALAIDTMELLCSHMYDAFAIVSSDSDYAPLAIKLRESGAYVIGVGNQKVTESFRSACDEFLCLEDLSAGTDDGISTEEDIVEGNDTPPESSNTDDNSTPPKEDPTAMDRMDGMDRIHKLLRLASVTFQSEDGYTDISDVGAFLKRTEPGFDPRAYGFKRVTQLIQAYPDRYEVIRNDGNFVFKCMIPEGEIEAEPKSAGTAADMDRIHHLLRFVWRIFREKKDYARATAAVRFIWDTTPDFNPYEYGFSKLVKLMQAFPDRYKVIKNDDGKIIYECVIPEEEDERGEALTQEDIAENLRNETGGTNAAGTPAIYGINWIHHLLQLACEAYRREDGYVTLAHTVYFFKYAMPDFNPCDYGFVTLSQLIQAFPDRYKVSRTDAGGLIYQYIPFKKANKTGTESGAVDSTGTPPEDADTAMDTIDDIDSIHKLLRLANKTYPRFDGYTDAVSAALFLKREKPGFDPGIYGFRTLAKFIQAYPDQYEVSRNDAGGLIYKCIAAEELNKAEELQTESGTSDDTGTSPKEAAAADDDSTPPEETAPADSIDMIHKLLRLACKIHSGENGYVTFANAGNFIKHSKPDFDPHVYGFKKLSQLIQAFPDQYAVIKDARGYLSYRCTIPEEADEREEALTQVDIQTQGELQDGAGMATSMDRIHHLLRFAWSAFRKEDGYVVLDAAGKFIQDVKPDFKPSDYGFPTLTRLIQSYPNRYEAIKDAWGYPSYRCILSEEPDEREEALEDIQAQGGPQNGTGDDTADRMDCVHYLLRRACDACQREDGSVTLARAVYFLKYTMPDFNPGDYGFESLSQLIQAFPDRYEVSRTDAGGLLYKYIFLWNSNKTEEERGAADGMDRIHHLLRFAWRSFRKEDGYTKTGVAVQFIWNAMPDSIPYEYGVFGIVKLMKAFPDRYHIRRIDDGRITYKCVIPVEADEREEALTQEDIQAKRDPRDGAGTANRINHVHHLLRRACDAYRRKDGYVTLAHVVHFFKYTMPDFDPGDYGFETLSQLVQAFPDRYEVSRTDSGVFLYRRIEEANKSEEPQKTTRRETEE